MIPTKFGAFLCIFESNAPDPGFTVSSPETTDFVTYGPTLREAKRMAKEGLEFHCECKIFESAERLPIEKPRQAKRVAVR